MAHDLKRAVLALAVIVAVVEYVNYRGITIEIKDFYSVKRALCAMSEIGGCH